MNIAAVVLAAGEGRRLGVRAKATLCVDGRTFLETIAASGTRAGVNSFCVVVGPPHLEETLAECERLTLNGVVNPHSRERGMASSVEAAFQCIAVDDFDAAFLWPVDIPFAKTETLEALVRRASTHSVIRPSYRGRSGHPPLIGSDYFRALGSCSTAEQGARTVLRQAPHCEQVEVDDPGILRDVDTLADLAQC